MKEHQNKWTKHCKGESERRKEIKEHHKKRGNRINHSKSEKTKEKGQKEETRKGLNN